MKSLFTKPTLLGTAVLALALTGCAAPQESQRVIDSPAPVSKASTYTGPRSTLGIGKFANSSPFMRGIFSDGKDRLGNQARTILKTHLAQTNRFSVVDRDNTAQLAAENKLAGQAGQTAGAQVIVTGDVTEFGRRKAGDKQLFGILGRGKRQIAYSKVSLNVVDVKTSRILFAAQGAGEYEMSAREVLGTGSTAGYDATLNGKVLDLSIREAVKNLVAGLEAGQWAAQSQ